MSGRSPPVRRLINATSSGGLIGLERKLKFFAKLCSEGGKCTADLIPFAQRCPPSSASLTIGERGQVLIAEKKMGPILVRREENALNAAAALTAEGFLLFSAEPYSI